MDTAQMVSLAQKRKASVAKVSVEDPTVKPLTDQLRTLGTEVRSLQAREVVLAREAFEVILAMYALGVPQSEIAKVYGVSGQRVHTIVNEMLDRKTAVAQ